MERTLCMKYKSLKKYDFINIKIFDRQDIRFCLVVDADKDNLLVLPIERNIEDVDSPRAIFKVQVPYHYIEDIEHVNISKLFYAVNSEHSIIKDALKFHMYNER